MALKDFSRSHPPDAEKLHRILAFKTETPDFRSLKVDPGERPYEKPMATGWMRKRFIFVQSIPQAGEYPVVFRMRPLEKPCC